MAIHLFECPVCGYRRESIRREPKCNHNQEEESLPTPVAVMRKLLTAPQAKFMEPTNKEKGKSNLKGQTEILKARAKEHSRQNDYHDAIQSNSPEMAKMAGWIREDGTVRKKIDDV